MSNKNDRNEFTVYMPDGRPAPPVLTFKETVDLLRITSRYPYQTIRRYEKLGLLKGHKVGRDKRYLLKDIVAFIENKQH